MAAVGSLAAQDSVSELEWIDFSAHMRVVGGVTTGDYEELASHGHDPNQDFTLQGLEVGVNLRANEYIQAFAAGVLYLDSDDDFETEWEEGFVKFLNLPGGFELRGGRYLNRIGAQNNVHLHGWDFVDANLVTSNFLGEDGLITEGGELSWLFEADEVDSILSLSFGNAVVHDHGHGEEHDEEDEDEEEEGHGHGGEEAFFADELLTARWMLRWQQNDFHRHEVGVNYGVGENGYGRDSTIWSADYYYTWRENGLERGGRYLQAGGEVYHRNVEWYDEEEGEGGDQGQMGLVLSLLYGFDECWETGLRYGWIEGAEDGPDGEVVFESEERKRLSAVLTRRAELANRLTGLARLQYNYDDLPEGDEHSVFFQIGIDWGGPEIR